MTFGKKL